MRSQTGGQMCTRSSAVLFALMSRREMKDVRIMAAHARFKSLRLVCRPAAGCERLRRDGQDRAGQPPKNIDDPAIQSLPAEWMCARGAVRALQRLVDSVSHSLTSRTHDTGRVKPARCSALGCVATSTHWTHFPVRKGDLKDVYST